MTASKGIWKVITASSVGTLIEWYDFYIFGSLATVIASQFFPKTNPTAALLSTLATFAAGFIVRPFGALVFGRLGDLVGRKYTFLLTLILWVVQLSHWAVPGYERIGFPRRLLCCRCACCRDWRWEANTEEPPLMLQNILQHTAGVIIPVGFKQLPLWVCSFRSE
jgi:MFS family permease